LHPFSYIASGGLHPNMLSSGNLGGGLGFVSPQPINPGSGALAPNQPTHEHVVLGSPVTINSGPLRVATISGIARRGVPAIRHCYQHGLDRDPTMAGRVVTQLAIDAHGAVLNSHVVDSSLSVPEVGACITQIERQWRFPNAPDQASPTVATVAFGLSNQ
jgi:hypothetical protein